MLKEEHLNRAGLKEKLELAPIYDRYSWLFSLDTIEGIKGAKIPRKKKRHLLEFAISFSFQQQIEQIKSEITTQETKPSIKWREELIPYRRAQSKIANEGGLKARHELYDRFMEATERINPLRVEQFNILIKHARELGWEDYTQLYDEIRMLHLASLSSMMESFLEETKDIYFSLLNDQLRKHNIPPGEARHCDLVHLLRAPEFDAHFDASTLLSSLHSTLLDLGIDLDKQPGISIDKEDRSLKRGRPFCSPIKVPGDIRVVISPRGGVQDYRALFHEVGHAEYYSHIRPGLSFAFIFLGDDSVTEGYAFLLENLVFNRNWLEKHFNSLDLDDFLSFARFQRIVFLRTFAAKILYEQKLYRLPDIQEAGELYSELFTKHVGVKYDERNYLADVDMGFYSAIYLRAWIFESQLRLYLEDKFGEDWFRNPKAGEFLKGLWSKGLEFNVEELARQLGYDGLDIKPLMDDILNLT